MTIMDQQVEVITDGSEDNPLFMEFKVKSIEQTLQPLIIQVCIHTHLSFFSKQISQPQLHVKYPQALKNLTLFVGGAFLSKNSFALLYKSIHLCYYLFL